MLIVLFCVAVLIATFVHILTMNAPRNRNLVNAMKGLSSSERQDIVRKNIKITGGTIEPKGPHAIIISQDALDLSAAGEAVIASTRPLTQLARANLLEIISAMKGLEASLSLAKLDSIVIREDSNDTMIIHLPANSGNPHGLIEVEKCVSNRD